MGTRTGWGQRHLVAARGAGAVPAGLGLERLPPAPEAHGQAWTPQVPRAPDLLF